MSKKPSPVSLFVYLRTFKTHLKNKKTKTAKISAKELKIYISQITNPGKQHLIHHYLALHEILANKTMRNFVILCYDIYICISNIRNHYIGH